MQILSLFCKVSIYWLFPLLCGSSLVWCRPICLFQLSFPVCLVSYPRNHCQDQCQGFFPVFSSKSFTVSGKSLFFKKTVLFVLDTSQDNFCECCMIGVQFHSFACGRPVFPAPLIENYPFPSVCSWCQKSVDCICIGLCPALYSVPLIYVPVFMSVPHCLDYYSFVI